MGIAEAAALGRGQRTGRDQADLDKGKPSAIKMGKLQAKAIRVGWGSSEAKT